MFWYWDIIIREDQITGALEVLLVVMEIGDETFILVVVERKIGSQVQ